MYLEVRLDQQNLKIDRLTLSVERILEILSDKEHNLHERITPKQAYLIFKVCTRKQIELRKSGKLEFTRVGSRILYTRKNWEDYFESINR